MTKLLIRRWIALFSLALGVVFSICALAEEPIKRDLSLVEILSFRKDWKGMVRVRGLTVDGGLSGVWMFFSKEHAERMLTDYAVFLAPAEGVDPMVPIGRWVSVTGFLERKEMTVDFAGWKRTYWILRVDSVKILQKKKVTPTSPKPETSGSPTSPVNARGEDNRKTSK